MTTTVSIGRATGEFTQLSPEDWHDYVANMGRVLRHWHPYCFFTGEGSGNSEDWGEEEAWTWVLADLPAYVMQQDYRADIEAVRKRFGQEAVAVTTGNTYFV